MLALLIGVVTGLRTAMPPAVLAWGVHRHWLDLHDSRLAFIGSTTAVVVLTVCALGELVVDKLPSAPNRTIVGGIVARVVLGGLSGAVIATAGSQSAALGALLGGAGGIAGAFGGLRARTGLVRALHVPDFVVACAEDAIAIGASVAIVALL